ncbi:MAG: NAD(P)H-hydrate epimerase [Tissierellia bacterium]|nr:NAD(P)H-hydrate epimerase [Tissierellia bacterium]
MITISCEEMKAMDSYAIQEIGIPSIVLMENAALKVIKNIPLETTNSFTIVCGVGNNGGDGLAIGRHLILQGKKVDLFILGYLNKGTRDFNINLNILKNMKVEFTLINGEDELEALKKSLNKNDFTIDGIFGVGLTRKIEGIYKDVISLINGHSKYILSVDIPSGLDGDTGEGLGIAVRADRTVTFHLAKKGLINNRDYTGDLIVESIGIPQFVTDIILKRME